jgi:hypothetical protein
LEKKPSPALKIPKSNKILSTINPSGTNASRRKSLLRVGEKAKFSNIAIGMTQFAWVVKKAAQIQQA